jgi:hypothetical protein
VIVAAAALAATGLARGGEATGLGRRLGLLLLLLNRLGLDLGRRRRRRGRGGTLGRRRRVDVLGVANLVLLADGLEAEDDDEPAVLDHVEREARELDERVLLDGLALEQVVVLGCEHRLDEMGAVREDEPVAVRLRAVARDLLDVEDLEDGLEAVGRVRRVGAVEREGRVGRELVGHASRFAAF